MIKFTSPRSIAVTLALVITFVLVVFASFFVYTSVLNSIELWIALVLAAFIIFYVLIYYTFSTFIFKRVNPIYKSIYRTNISDSEIKSKLETKDIFSTINKEVDQWGKNKTKEILQLRKLAKYRKEFLGNVSHELKTPLFSIQGYISTLLDGGLEDEKINRHYLEKSGKNINRMIAIINDLETISKFETEEIQLRFTNFDIVQLVKEVFEMNENLADKKSIKLLFKRQISKAIMVNANREKLFVVISNLIINSIKYGKENGVTTVDFLDMDKNYLVEITDNGIGINSNDLPRIFERFFRADKSRSREAGGTGLGLAIVKHVIEAHKQTINCSSSIGKGTSFSFTIKKAAYKIIK